MSHITVVGRYLSSTEFELQYPDGPSLETYRVIRVGEILPLDGYHGAFFVQRVIKKGTPVLMLVPITPEEVHLTHDQLRRRIRGRSGTVLKDRATARWTTRVDAGEQWLYLPVPTPPHQWRRPFRHDEWR